MDKSDVIQLVQKTYTKDAKGVNTAVETLTEVFCQADSITQSEFFSAGAQGIKPDWRFTLFAYDYSNETVVIYEGVRYQVYRTYRTKDDDIELYCQKDVGA